MTVESSFSSDHEAVIQNHLFEIAALSEDKFEELKERVVSLGNIVTELAVTFHPDRPEYSFDLGWRFATDFSLACEIVRRASKIREIRQLGSQNG